MTGAVPLAALAINAWLTGHRERSNRRRQILSKAFSSTVAYKEFPYVVRRRRSSSPEDERIRISTELRKVQEDIAYHLAWLTTESQHVYKAYNNLVSRLREVAGAEIRKAWNEPPARIDAEMNIDDIDLGTLGQLEQEYLLEASDHLSIFPRWLRRMLRRAR